MKKISLLLIFILPSLVFAQEMPDEASACNLPDEFSIQEKGDLPKNFAAFLGVISGKWDGEFQASLIISTVDVDGDVDGYYAYAAAENLNIPEAGCGPFRGKITKRKLKFKFQDLHAFLTFKFEGDQFSGKFQRQNELLEGKFTKLN